MALPDTAGLVCMTINAVQVSSEGDPFSIRRDSDDKPTS
jgi:hypothetical protein